MSELEEITKIIDVILGNDNQARKNSEALLENLRDKDFNGYIYAFTTVLRDSPNSAVKVFCIAHLRRLLSDFLDAEDGRWVSLRPETQRFVKDVSMHMLREDKDVNSRKVLCDFIGELVSTIQSLDADAKSQCSQEGLQWDEIMQVLWDLLNSGNVNFMENALRILSVLFTHCGRHYSTYNKDLLPLLKVTLTHQSPVVNVATMEALSAYIENAEFKHCRPFLELMPLMLSQTLVVADQNEDYALDALGAIADILDTEPKMFRKDCKQLVDVLKMIIKSKAEDRTKQSALETLILTIERLPKKFVEDLQTVKEIAELIFTYMISTDEEPDDEWLNPPEGYVEAITDDDSPDSSIRFCMGLIDRIIGSLSKKPTLAMFSQLIGEMVKVNDWKYQHCALMSLSQVGEYIDDMDEFDPIVGFIVNFLQSDHPKVRYAALHCLGQSAEDCRPAFQKRYAETVLPTILSIYNDRVPKVVYHALNATANFLEECPKDIAVRYLQQILEPSIHFLETGRSLLKESALTVIGNLAEVCGSDFIPVWEKVSDIIFIVLNNTKKEIKTVKGNAIEALSLIGEAVGRTEFKKVCHAVIQKMVEIQTNDLGKLDPQNVFMMASWHRICSVLQDDFTPYLNFVMPSIFKLVEDIINAEDERDKQILEDESEQNVVSRATKNKKQAQDNQGDDDGLFYQVNTSESEEIITAIKMMRGFAYELKAGYLPYAEQTSDVIVHLISKSSNEEVRQEAADSFVDLIGVMEASNHPGKQEIIRKLNNAYLEILWEATWSELDAEMMRKYVDIMMEVILKAGKCMSEEELNKFNECVLKTLKLSDQRKTENFEYHNQNADENDEDDEEMLVETNKLEEELHMALAELIGTLFRVYKEQTMPLVKLIYNEILPKTLAPEASVTLNKFGLYLIDDMIEHLGIELIPEEWPNLSEALIKYATHPDAQVRNAAVYGIGALGETSKEVFKGMSDVCMKVLYECLDIPKKAGEDLEDFGAAHDSILASLGKIIKAQHNSINLKEAIRVWVNHLPLRFDMDEAKVQHELLVDIILESDAALIFGENGENLPRTVRVLAEVLDTKASSEEFKPKVGKVLRLLAGSEGTKALLQDAVGKLDAKLQKKLQAAAETQ